MLSATQTSVLESLMMAKDYDGIARMVHIWENSNSVLEVESVPTSSEPKPALENKAEIMPLHISDPLSSVTRERLWATPLRSTAIRAGFSLEEYSRVMGFGQGVGLKNYDHFNKHSSVIEHRAALTSSADDLGLLEFVRKDLGLIEGATLNVGGADMVRYAMLLRHLELKAIGNAPIVAPPVAPKAAIVVADGLNASKYRSAARRHTNMLEDQTLAARIADMTAHLTANGYTSLEGQLERARREADRLARKQCACSMYGGSSVCYYAKANGLPNAFGVVKSL